MFEILLKVIPLASSSLKWVTTLQDEKREALASLFDRIGTILETYANATDDERQSINLCGELEVYAPNIRGIARNILEDNQLNEMADKLQNVCVLWRENSKKIADGSTNDNVALSEISYAAGHFHGLARYVRTM